MPRKRVPEDKILGAQTELQQSSPDDGRRRLGKTVAGNFPFAGSPRRDPGKNSLRIDSSNFAQQHALGGHGDAAEMSAAITERLADDNPPRFAGSFAQVGAQMCAADGRGIAADVVPRIHFPPRIKRRATGRLFQSFDKPINRMRAHRRKVGNLAQTIQSAEMNRNDCVGSIWGSNPLASRQKSLLCAPGTTRHRNRKSAVREFVFGKMPNHGSPGGDH